MRLLLALAVLIVLGCVEVTAPAPRLVRVPQCRTVVDTIWNRVPGGSPPFVLWQHDVCA